MAEIEHIITVQNVAHYAIENNLCSRNQIKVERPQKISGKNYNLLLDLQAGNSLLIKQERQYSSGKTLGEFSNEWQVYRLLEDFPELHPIRLYFPKTLHFDADNSIIVFEYQKNYQDLAEFYIKKNIYPTLIPEQIGKILAKIHRVAERKEYQEFLFLKQKDNLNRRILEMIGDLNRITPEIYSMVTADALKFYSLYQRYDSLKNAIVELANALQPCCLIHSDLKLSNILLHQDWRQEHFKTKQNENALIKLIDWERGTWGDPAFDLGTVIASYLQLWLESLVVSKSIDLKTSMSLATTPLTLIQPSIAALIKAYIHNSPKILESYPNFLLRVTQCAGLSLIIQILAMIQLKYYFGNKGICMLQVAKSLLCHPKNSFPIICGTTELKLANYQ